MSAVWLAAPADAGHVARLLGAFRDWMKESAPDDDSIAASVAQLITDPQTEYLLGALADGGRPAGVCQLRYRHSVWTGSPDCWLEDLYVDAPARRDGLGRALVLAAIERGHARGARRIELDTNADNHGAIALYESLGFSASSKVHGAMRGQDLFMGRAVPARPPSATSGGSSAA
jgi:ribosomal protein S18 acetylase RimI-like enzyme